MPTLHQQSLYLMTSQTPPQWINEINLSLTPPKSDQKEIDFYNSLCKAPQKLPAHATEILMGSFLDPYESSTMQLCMSILENATFDEYYNAYIKILPELIAKQPDMTLSLLNYPRAELSQNQISIIIHKIKQQDPSGKLKGDLDHCILEWNLKDYEPWSSIYYHN